MKKIILALALALFANLFITPTTYAETAEEYFRQGDQFAEQGKYEQAIESNIMQQ